MRISVLMVSLGLAGCASTAIYQDPKTGQVQQCTTNVPPTLPLIAQQDIDKCAQAFEAMGWKKVK